MVSFRKEYLFLIHPLLFTPVSQMLFSKIFLIEKNIYKYFMLTYSVNVT